MNGLRLANIKWRLIGTALSLLVPMLVSAATIKVDAYIDGRSQLTLQGKTARWHHFDYAAPGRWNGANFATSINGANWFPVWPDVPTAENVFCNCDTVDTFAAVAPAISPVDQTVTLTPLVARGSVSVVQQPQLANGYKLIVEFNDPAGGAAWYSVNINVPFTEVQPIPTLGEWGGLVLVFLIGSTAVGYLRRRQR